MNAELPRWLTAKESVCQHRTLRSIPGSGRSPGEGNSNPFQYSCLENPIYREAWQATVHSVAEESVTASYDLVTREQLTATSVVVGYMWLLMATIVIVVVTVNGDWLLRVVGAGGNEC